MVTNKQRKFFTPSNKYQEKILLMAFIPVFLIILVLIFTLLVLREQIIKGAGEHSVSMLLSWAHQWYLYIVIGLCALFVFIVWIAFKISEDLLGAFTRIIPELDAVIEGRSKKLITTRPGDELAQVLLKRINVLIQSYIDHKK